MPLIPGLNILKRTEYSDARIAGENDLQPLELQDYMNRYPQWRSLYDGTSLEEQIESSDTKAYRWPVRYNLVHSYCQLYAGLLWGRGRTGAESNDLFEIRVDDKVPGAKPYTAAAPKLRELFQYFWAQQSHVLRPNSVIQQWAGGCVLKVSWNPISPSAVFGIQIETIQPEHFFPVWDPLNFEVLYAVRIRFTVSKQVALEKYNVTSQQLKDFGDVVPVEEYWDRLKYRITLGSGEGKVVARNYKGQPMEGANPYVHPVTKVGVIPFVYIPRIRSGSFLGESLAYQLEGLQNELNKTLADYGDALTRGAHPAFGISDFKSKKEVISIPRHGALNMGITRAGGSPPKVHEFPSPNVPEKTDVFIEKLLSLSEQVSGLTPAATGSSSAKSSLTFALEMLPTTNLIDWQRSHWSQGIGGRGGINEIAAVIWKGKAGATSLAPGLPDGTFSMSQQVQFKPVIPRDRLEIVDEVVRLATANAVSPQEWLKRLGDIEDIDEEMGNLVAYLAWLAMKEAAVAGRAIKVSEPTNPKNPAEAMPAISGETVEPSPKQQAKEPEGLPKKQDGS